MCCRGVEAWRHGGVEAWRQVGRFAGLRWDNELERVEVAMEYEENRTDHIICSAMGAVGDMNGSRTTYFIT